MDISWFPYRFTLCDITCVDFVYQAPFFLYKLKEEGRKVLCILMHNDINIAMYVPYDCGGQF